MEGTSGEPTPFTGTIYRNSTEIVFNGGSIVPGTKNVYCAVNEAEEYNSCTDENWPYDNESECLAAINGFYGYECVPGTVSTGLASYETEATKSNITEDHYLKHDVVNNIVEATYACIRYTDSVTNELVEACVQGGDSSYNGYYDYQNPENSTGNVKTLVDIQTSFERSLTNGACDFRYSSSDCSSTSFTLYSSSDSYVTASSRPHSGCKVHVGGNSYCY